MTQSNPKAASGCRGCESAESRAIRGYPRRTPGSRGLLANQGSGFERFYQIDGEAPGALVVECWLCALHQTALDGECHFPRQRLGRQAPLLTTGCGAAAGLSYWSAASVAARVFGGGLTSKVRFPPTVAFRLPPSSDLKFESTGKLDDIQRVTMSPAQASKRPPVSRIGQARRPGRSLYFQGVEHSVPHLSIKVARDWPQLR